MPIGPNYSSKDPVIFNLNVWAKLFDDGASDCFSGWWEGRVYMFIYLEYLSSSVILKSLFIRFINHFVVALNGNNFLSC